LRHYATSQKAAGSIPNEVIEFLNLPNLSSRTMALGSTQPLTEMSTRNVPGDKGRPVLLAYNLTSICEPVTGIYFFIPTVLYTPVPLVLRSCERPSAESPVILLVDPRLG
jgi:hypothetical protein